MCTCVDYHTSFSEKRVRLARKLYKCGECESDIAIGQKYTYCVGKTDNDFWSFKMCLECSSDWELLTDATFFVIGEACICYGNLKDEVNEAVDSGWLDWDNHEHRKMLEKWCTELGMPDEDSELSEEMCISDGKQAHFSFFN